MTGMPLMTKPCDASCHPSALQFNNISVQARLGFFMQTRRAVFDQEACINAASLVVRLIILQFYGVVLTSEFKH
jgi:hypothetical protein